LLDNPNFCSFFGMEPEIKVETSCDRSTDFFRIANQLGNRSHEYEDPRKGGVSHFIDQSSALELQMSDVDENLARLEKLTKNANLFNTQSEKIQELTNGVDFSINDLDREIKELDQIIDAERSGNDHMKESSDIIVEILKSKLFHMTERFKSLLQARTENLKQTEERRSNLSFVKPSKSALENKFVKKMKNKSMKQKGGNQNPFSHLGKQNGVHATTPGGANHADPESNALLGQEEVYDTQYHENRLGSIEEIQKTLYRLSDMYNRMGQVVHEHEIMIGRIEDSTEKSLHNMREGRNQLVEYHEGISSNRKLVIKVFMILMVFAALYIMFVV